MFWYRSGGHLMEWIIGGIIVGFIILWVCCKVGSIADNRTYRTDTEKLDDSITVEEIIDQLGYDDTFVKKEDDKQ